MSIQLKDLQHNIGLEADILEECSALLDGPHEDLSNVLKVRDRLDRMVGRMRERERGERA